MRFEIYAITKPPYGNRLFSPSVTFALSFLPSPNLICFPHIQFTHSEKLKKWPLSHFGVNTQNVRLMPVLAQLPLNWSCHFHVYEKKTFKPQGWKIVSFELAALITPRLPVVIFQTYFTCEISVGDVWTHLSVPILYRASSKCRSPSA